MSIYNLDYIFKPRSVAVIGASERPGSIGASLMQNLLQAEFKGRLIPVNPNRSTIFGIPAHSSIADVKQEVDLVIIATPMASVPGIVDTSVRAGVKGAVIVSAGGKETGRQGQEIERQIQMRAKEGGLRIIGPNCLGIICPANRLNASFAAYMPDPGKLAFISQSGAICSSMLDLSVQEKMGFRYFISIGNMLDVDFGDLIDYVGSDPQVESVLLYVESLSNLRKFMSAARSVSRLKPIVIIKSGRSPAGAKAATSHTGALAGEDSVYDAAFRRAGAVRVRTIGDFFRCAELLAKQPRPRGPRMTVITNSGGPGVMAVDALYEYGLESSTLSQQTLDRLNQVLPPQWSHGNPIDILGDATVQRYVQAVECLRTEEMDGLLVILNPQAMTSPSQVAAGLIKVLSRKPFPVLTSWMGGQGVQEGIEIFNNARLPTFDTPEDAIKAFMYCYDYSKNLEKLTEIPTRVSCSPDIAKDRAQDIVQTGLIRDGGLLTEKESKDLLQAYGLVVNQTEVAVSEDEAVQLARSLGYPLVMKLLSLDITHKTEAGGVQLNLQNEDELRSAFVRIMQGAIEYKKDARIIGVSLQAMIIRPELELLLGVKRDDNFGPVILFGLGGIFAEVLQDRNIALPPLNHLLVRRLIEGTKVASLLKGFRNRPGADMTLLEETIIKLSHLVIDFPEITELDINPLIIQDGKPMVIDARAVVQPSRIASPHHLVISPYPAQYEFPGVVTDGLKIDIRPIQPEDASLLVELFENLSPTSIYFRFFRPLKMLPLDMLARFTQIDYDREMALVALARLKDREQMLGLARVIGHVDATDGEFAVLIGDPWQGKGVGAELLKRCLDIARHRMHMRQIWGMVLKENTGMLKLGEKLGFQRKWLSREQVFELTLDLNRMEAFSVSL